MIYHGQSLVVHKKNVVFCWLAGYFPYKFPQQKHGIFRFEPSQVGDDRPSMRDCERAVIHEVIQQGYLWIFLVPEIS